ASDDVVRRSECRCRAGYGSDMSSRLGALTLDSMASGHLCLEVSQTVGWAGFPKYAEALVSRLGATVLDKAEAPDIRIWRVGLEGCVLRLVYEDSPSGGATFEHDSDDGDRLVRELKERFESGAVRL